MNKRIKIFLSITLIAFITSIVIQVNVYYENEYTYSIAENEQRKMNIQALSKTWSRTITIGANGDMLIHDYVYNDAKTNKSYEFKPMLKSYKKELSMPGYGVDIIFGHHPHVLQLFEWIEKNGKRVFVAYSLGNFLSRQLGHYKDFGGMATIQVTKTETVQSSIIRLSNPKFYPSYVSSNQKLSSCSFTRCYTIWLKEAKTTYSEWIKII